MDDLELVADADYAKVTSAVLAEALNVTDWHLDVKRPMTSVVFRVEKGGKGSEVIPQCIPDSLLPLHRCLLLSLKRHDESTPVASFALEIKGLRYRVEKIRAGRYALRLIARSALPLESLGLGESVNEILLDPDYRAGGLILIAGAPGAGKTTTAVSTVVGRLEKFGGFCLGLEDPVECIFEGFHGAGYAEQIDASIAGVEMEVARAMRKFPAEIKSMFYFGEILERVAAAEITRLMARGHLVITTIHANDTVRAIEMLVAFAEQGGETYARQLIGGSLLAVVHQQLVQRKPVVIATRINEAMRNIISNPEANLFLLSSEIDLARRQRFSRRLSDRNSSATA